MLEQCCLPHVCFFAARPISIVKLHHTRVGSAVQINGGAGPVAIIVWSGMELYSRVWYFMVWYVCSRRRSGTFCGCRLCSGITGGACCATYSKGLAVSNASSERSCYPKRAPARFNDLLFQSPASEKGADFLFRLVRFTSHFRRKIIPHGEEFSCSNSRRNC